MFQADWPCWLKNLFSVSGKTAVVTGGASGIGAEIARAYYELGAKVMLVDIDPEALARQKRAFDESGAGICEIFPCDVAVEAQVRQLRDEAMQKFGRIDILLNSHGISRRASADHITEKEFDDVIAVNLKGTFLTTALLGRIMVGQKSGCIVNVSSIAAHVCMPNNVNYAAAKGGLEAMTRSFAGEWAKHGVRVNAIAPGPCKTNFTKTLYEDPEYVKNLIAKIPRGAISEAVDMVGPALLLSSDAGVNLLGQTLVVDGGFTIL